ncbi:hypothetical protein BJY04DRAFT_76106 [Aspergillus karnatakaensis]|uniref:uncharacterized protein n=1 Tax=Aspergillus karnatakaensis TaxID=1810916 RepID=UPI003CCE1008
MRKFVKFLGGGQHVGVYESVWTKPAPESGFRDPVVNSQKKDTLSTKKPESSVHISKLTQQEVAELETEQDKPVAELQSPVTPTTTTSTFRRTSATDGSIAELESPVQSQRESKVAELDSPNRDTWDIWPPIVRRKKKKKRASLLESETASETASRKGDEDEGKDEEQPIQPPLPPPQAQPQLSQPQPLSQRAPLVFPSPPKPPSQRPPSPPLVLPSPPPLPQQQHPYQKSPAPSLGPQEQQTSAPTPPAVPKVKSPAARSPDTADLLIFDDDMDAIPSFGRQFGIARTSIVREQEAKEAEPEREPEITPAPVQAQKTDASLPKGPEAFFQQVDEELEALYADYLKSAGKPKPIAKETKKVSMSRWKSKAKPKPQLKPKAAPEACIICLEPFSPLGVKAPDTISIACHHPSSVCYSCLAKSIKHDLETKFWDEIKCPECKTLLIHDDIKRFADEETFTRYDKLSLRAALTSDKNFIWCLDCDFGQLHESGTFQPQVRCLNCSAISCFKHAIKWHDGFTCDEYDTVLWDPDSYKATKALSAAGGSAGAGLEVLSKKAMSKLMRKEQTRQTKLHERQKKEAREKQVLEAKRVQEEKELEDAARLAQQLKEEEEAAAAAQQGASEDDEEINQADVQDDFKEKIELLKRRMREAQLSMQKVEETTKRCPGCEWPIEKNEGCDHMTCIKCRFEFCWECMNDYNEIRRYGNSMHKPSCKFHTDNLP